MDSTGDVFVTYQYTAFGILITSPPAWDTNPFRFNGEYWDWERDEYYLRARSYNPNTGRFTQADPFWNNENQQDSPLAILQAANLYVYTVNNPVKWRDPSGLFVSGALSLISGGLLAGSIANNIASNITSSSGGAGFANSGPSGAVGIVGTDTYTIDRIGANGVYLSLYSAARAFARATNQMSIDNNWEYGTYFYSWRETLMVPITAITLQPLFVPVQTTFYSYTTPHTNYNPNRVAFAGDYHNLDVSPPIPEGATWVGIGHTHSAYSSDRIVDGIDWNNRFSENDKILSYNIEHPIFLVSPDGRLQEYDPTRGRAYRTKSIITFGIPRDRNHP
jgi:RHS repeat-associated protein